MLTRHSGRTRYAWSNLAGYEKGGSGFAQAALQFVRKISGFNKPSQINQAAFDTAVRDVAAAGRVLFRSLHVHGHTQAAI